METHIQNQNHSSNYGLLRFRSAPTSLLANFTDDDDCGANKGSPGEGSESGRLISRFMNQVNNSDSDTSTGFLEFEDKSQMIGVTRAIAPDPNGANSQLGQYGLPPYYPRQSSGDTGSSTVDTSYGIGLFGSSLSRQNSSPAGFFPPISASNEYSAMRGMGSYGGTNGSEGDGCPSPNRLKSQLSFSSRLPSRLGILPDISEIGDKSIAGADKKLGNNNRDAPLHGPGFAYGSWIGSSPFGENFGGGIKRDYHKDGKLFPNSQNEKLRNAVHLLSHQSSMPQTSSEVLAIEKFLQFQESVPCRIRAKRGCATHPRSIAERVRRTRISERMRKLQELVPNMDKQTNTADMLDLAVDYIKDLQKQFKALSTNRANCKCVITKKSATDHII